MMSQKHLLMIPSQILVFVSIRRDSQFAVSVPEHPRSNIDDCSRKKGQGTEPTSHDTTGVFLFSVAHPGNEREPVPLFRMQ